MVNAPVVMMKTFTALTTEELDKKCNDFKLNNKRYKFVATQININNGVYVASIFFESWD